MSRIRVKICCIANTDEAHLALSAGADAIGLVGPMPSGPGVLELDQARAIAAQTPAPLARFLLSSSDNAEDLAKDCESAGTDTLQIVRHVDPDFHRTLAETLPHVRRIQVIHIEDDGAIGLIDRYAGLVHGFLLDSGRPSAAVEELGGTGRVHDWSISRAFVEASPIPVFLAGGLGPDNITDAIAQVRPFGVDICSGIRRDGHLDVGLLKRFMQQIRRMEGAS